MLLGLVAARPSNLLDWTYWKMKMDDTKAPARIHSVLDPSQTILVLGRIPPH